MVDINASNTLAAAAAAANAAQGPHRLDSSAVAKISKVFGILEYLGFSLEEKIRTLGFSTAQVRTIEELVLAVDRLIFDYGFRDLQSRIQWLTQIDDRLDWRFTGDIEARIRYLRETRLTEQHSCRDAMVSGDYTELYRVARLICT